MKSIKNKKYISLFAALFFGLPLCASTYADRKKVAYEFVQDLPGSIERLQSRYTQEEILDKIFEHDKNNYKEFRADWSGGHQKAFHACIAKYRLQGALFSYYACDEQKVKIIKKSEEDALACIERFDDFRTAYVASSFTKTKTEVDLRDKQANKKFKP